MSHLASIPRDERYICAARLDDGSARYCRRRATRFVISDDAAEAARHASLWRRPGTPVCDIHARREAQS